MRRAIVTLAAALVTLIASVAIAAPQDKTARGKITAVSGSSITLDVKGQPMTLSVDPKTEVIAKGAGTKTQEAQRTTGANPKLTDLAKVGDNVEVTYSEAGGTMMAKTIRKISTVPSDPAMASSAASKHLEGVISDVSASSLTVKPATGDAMQFMVDAKTRITGTGLSTMTREKQAKGEAVTLTDAVASGDTVEVTYTATDDMKHATAVRIIKKKM